MDRPSILILAATRYQVPFILRAKEMGWRVVTLDNHPPNPGHRLADCCHFVSTTDEPAVLDVARREKVDGILAACTDVAALTAARTARRLGLPGQNPEVVEVLGSKAQFRMFQRHAGLPHPAWQTVPPGGADPGLGGRRLYKPDRGSGSRGITRVEAEETGAGLLERAAEASVNGFAVVETSVDGFHVTCEGLWDGSKAMLALVTERLPSGGRHPATRGHRFPSGLDGVTERALVADAECLLSRLDAGPCLFDLDAVVGENGQCTILEMAPRAGGNCLSLLMQSVLGYDWTGAALHLALGQDVPVPGPRVAEAGLIEILGAAQDSLLCYDPELAVRLKGESPWLSSLEFDVPPGGVVAGRIDGRTRCGEVVLVAATRAEAENRLDLVLRHTKMGFLPLPEACS